MLRGAPGARAGAGYGAMVKTAGSSGGEFQFGRRSSTRIASAESMKTVTQVRSRLDHAHRRSCGFCSGITIRQPHVCLTRWLWLPTHRSQCRVR